MSSEREIVSAVREEIRRALAELHRPNTDDPFDGLTACLSRLDAFGRRIDEWLASPEHQEPREPEAEALMARVVAAYEAGEWSCVADTFYPRSREHDLANAIDAMRVYLTGKRESREGPMREERCGTSVAPAGWWCSRERGHDGPCAAHNEPLPTGKRVEREGPMREDR